MDMKEVVSSNIHKIGYDGAELKLGVIFKKSPTKLYIFHPVEPTVHQKLMKADSHGKYFNANIQNNKRFSVHTEQVVDG
jgi:hypothetical protein